MTKGHYFLGIFFIFILSLNSKIMDYGLLWIKGAPMYEMHTNEKLNHLWTCIFLMMHHCYQIHYKMHNNINTHVHVKKHNVCRFHYLLPPMCETKILEPLQINGNYLFSQQYLHTQTKNICQYLKDLKENEDI
jgi:hypothetical protein